MTLQNPRGTAPAAPPVLTLTTHGFLAKGPVPSLWHNKSVMLSNLAALAAAVERLREEKEAVECHIN